MRDPVPVDVLIAMYRTTGVPADVVLNMVETAVIHQEIMRRIQGTVIICGEFGPLLVQGPIPERGGYAGVLVLAPIGTTLAEAREILGSEWDVFDPGTEQKDDGKYRYFSVIRHCAPMPDLKEAA